MPRVPDQQGGVSESAGNVACMCGRYASSSRPETLQQEFDIDEILGDLPGPDFNVAPTVAVPAVLERRSKSRRLRGPPAEPAGLGTGAVLGEGRQGRRPDDQRPGRDGGREAGLPTRLRRPPVPAAGRRVLRVVRPGGDRADPGSLTGRQGQEATVLHPPRRRQPVGDGRHLRDLARSRQGPRRRLGLAADLLGDHHRGHRRRRAHPRPDADGGAPQRVGRLAGPRR